MDPKAVRTYAGRDWAAVERSRRDHWAGRAREGDGLAPLRAVHALYAYVRRVCPDFPAERDRVADLHEHVELKRKLDRAASAFAVH